MAIDHEACYAALATRLQTYCAQYIKIPVSRKIISYDQVPQESMPCIFSVATHQSPRVDGPLSAVWTLGAAIVIYARADVDPNASAETEINTLLGRIEAALEKQSDETSMVPGQTQQHWTTLGGTVLFIHPGTIEMELGAQGNQGIAIFPVDMLLMPSL